MNKLDKFLTKYFFYSISLLIITAIIGTLKGEDYLASSTGYLRIAWDILGWNLMLWIACGLYIFIKMIANTNFRDLTLKRLIGTVDRDERESFASGEAAKVSIISTTALSIFLLFLSLININIGKNNSSQLSESSPKHFISIGINSLSKANKNEQASANQESIFIYDGLPLSMPAILLVIILWQIFTFRSITRRKLII